MKSMTFRNGMLVLALTLGFSIVANATNEVYTVNLSGSSLTIAGNQDLYSVSGTITTNGAFGALSSSSISSFDLTIIDSYIGYGASGYTLNSATNSVFTCYGGCGLMASATSLVIAGLGVSSFSPTAAFGKTGATVDIFQSQPSFGVLQLCSSAMCYGHNLSSNILSSEAMAAVPEPDENMMMLIGLGLMGFITRRTLLIVSLK